MARRAGEAVVIAFNMAGASAAAAADVKLKRGAVVGSIDCGGP